MSELSCCLRICAANRKTHLKETQSRIADLNDKLAVATATLQQAISGMQARLEEENKKVRSNLIKPGWCVGFGEVVFVLFMSEIHVRRYIIMYLYILDAQIFIFCNALLGIQF